MKIQKSVFVILILLGLTLSTSKNVSATQTSNIRTSGIKLQVNDSLVLKNIKKAKSATFYEGQKMKLKTENGSIIKGRLISANKDSIVLSAGTFNFVFDTKDVTKIIIPKSFGAQVVGFVVIGVGVYIIVASGVTVLWGALGSLEPGALWVVPVGLVAGAAGYGTTILGYRIRNRRFDLNKNWQIQ